MEFIKSLFNDGYSIKPNTISYNKPTNMLDQGRELLNNQYKREVSFLPNTQLLEKDSMFYEGFVNNVRNANNVSNTLDKNINNYDNEYSDLIADARAYTKKTDRNIEVNRHFKEHIDLLYDIKANKEGCVKSVTPSSLIYQSNMQDVSEHTCKSRALDEGYAGFSIKKGANGQLGCYLTNDIEREKKGELAIKPMTSYSFKNNKDANMGGLLLNGQVGTYKNNLNTNLVTDLESCSKDNSLINEKSIIATYGGNCKKK